MRFCTLKWNLKPISKPKTQARRFSIESGPFSDLGDGFYTDVETVITHNIRNWIIEETRSLDEFDQVRFPKIWMGFRIYSE